MFRPSSEVEIANEVCWAEERRKAAEAEAEAEKVKSKQMAAIANAKLDAPQMTVGSASGS